MGYIEELRAVVGHRPLILNGAKVLIVDESGRLLLQKRKDGIWDIPGGLMEPGESLEETARREVYEETGLDISKLQLLGVFSGPGYFVTLPNGDQYYAVTTAYVTRDYSGVLTTDGVESTGFGFFSPSEIPAETNPKMLKIISKFFSWQAV